MSADRLDLLDLLLEREGVESPIRPSIPRRAPGASAPLSFGQQRLFFLDRWSPGNPTYNVNAAFRLTGRLDPAALAAALAEIVRRHETLRTAFALFEGAPMASIISIDPPSALLPAPVSIVDLSALAAGPAGRAQAAALKRRAREPFDLSRAPLLRSLLIRRAVREHALILSVHHIATDGWSMGNLAREMIALYGAFARRQKSPLPELPSQYADYALRQRGEADSVASEAQLEYWRRRLAGAPPILELPTDRRRPAEAGPLGASSPVRLPADLAARLGDLGRRERATSFMVLLAGFAALLTRHGAGEDLVVGTPLANRGLPETEPLIGFLVNMVALRLDLSGDPAFRDLVARTQREALAAFDHQDLPFERLVEALDLARDASATPVFQVAFVLQNTPEARFELPELEIEALAAETATAKFDLLLGLREGRSGIGGSLEYRSELFAAATMARWCERYESLLAAAAERPEIRLSDLPVLTSAERVELLASPVEETVSQSLAERFAVQAALRPDAVAVSSGDLRLSYGEVFRRAEALAARLRALGVGAEDRVALVAARDASLVEGIVGILVAGAAYVPLDPSYPEARLRLLLEDSGPRAVVAARAALEGFPVAAFGAAPVVRLDEIDSSSRPASSAALWPEPDAAAYVIYTSGSTGRPKGVTVSHANVARLFSATAARFGFDETQVWSLFHSFAFDFSVWELWGALLAGGRVAIVPWWTSRSPEAFRDFLAEEDVTHLSQTPSAFRQLIRADATAGPLAALRAVTFGGEALEAQGLAPWLERYGDRGPALVNMYGITETTVHVTYRRIERRDLAQSGVGSAIGVPIADLSVRVLDARGSLAPPGVPGELCVGGAGLARGYLGRPDLTAERFVPDGFSNLPGARLYRSGDLGRRGLDGDLEYLGRIDHQVKVRGFRIELGEIEAALAEHPDVAEAVVVARGEEGEARLASYLVFRPRAAPSIEALRSFLRDRLPEHMVPATFMELKTLPLTPHGKVDRRALPAPGGARPGLASEFEAPRDEVERQLAAIWAAVVGVGTIGIHDNFFALGGDSIRSLKVLSLARECGLEFSLQDLFRHQTVAELASALRPGGTAAGEPAAVASTPFDLVSTADRSLLPPDVVDAYPLAFLQVGMLYHIDQTPDSPAYHNVDSIHLRGPFDPERFQEAVNAVVERHPMLRTSFHLTGFSEALQLVHESVELPVGTADLSDLSAEEQEAWIDRRVAEEHLRLFDPTRAPLLRLHLARRSAETFQLTLTENHAIFDGWSLHATLREIFDRYLALVAGGRPEREAPPEIPYREYVRLEREAIRSAEQKAFWRDRLAGWEGGGLPRLPGYPRHGHGPRMRTLSWRVPDELVEGLRRAALEVGAPLKSALLAVHAKALGTLWGRAEVLTGLASNGRPEARGGDEIRGLFLNMVPLRMALAGGSWKALIRAAFEAESAMLPFRRYPMGLIQNERGDRSLLESAFTYIYFHSVEELVNSGRIEVLGFKRAEQTHFPLASTFTISPVTSRLTLLIDCDTQELAPEQVDPLLGWFERALTAMARTSEARHDDLCLLSDADREQVLSAHNATERGFEGLSGGGEALLGELVARSAARTPDAPAVLDDRGRCLTYAELLVRADQIAERLRAAGVGREDRVGVCLDRSPEMPVALLGVLRAGAAWLPLDPSLPFDRLAFMVEDGDVAALIADGGRLHLAGQLGGGRRPVLAIDVESPYEAVEPKPGLPGDADQAAYAIYTSGSTGRPKGVLVSHRAIANRVLWMARRFPLGPRERVAQKTPFSFDASIWELFSPLLAGATVVLAEPEGHKDMAYLARFAKEHEIAVLQLVPSLLGPFLAEPDLSVGRLARVFCGGEALPADLVRRFRERLPGVEIHNLYGPTEAAIDAASNSDLDGLETPIAPIGLPIDNDRLYVVDPHGQPSPIGAPGELWIAGRGLARGYLGRPDLTAERFVPDPWAASPETSGGRAYRTGDLARRLASGAIEFLGRVDSQTKLRGFRIEFEEVEAALALHPGVRAAAVAIHGAEPESRRLVAYFEARDGAAPGAADLAVFVAERLPEQMVPRAFVALAELPRTAGGKLDRKALVEPTVEAERPKGTVARSVVEEIVASLCAQVLEVESVGLDDSFLALGGHSLQAIQLALRLRQTFHTELRVRHVLQSASLRALAATIERNLAIGLGAKEELLVPLPRNGAALPLSFAQRSLWALHQMDPAKSAVYHIPMAVRLSGPLDRALLGRALDELVRRHETLRTVFAVVDEEPRQAVLDPQPVAIRSVDLSDLAAEQRALAIRREIAADQGAPFDLARGPLFRFALLRLLEDEHVGLLTFHHIISDGWSTGVLLRELAALYRAFGAGEPSPLSPLPIQYADFASWQRASLGEGAIEKQVGYWRERLAGAPALLDLAGDRPRPPVRSGRGGVVARLLPAALGSSAGALARSAAATPFMAYLAAFSVLLRHVAGRGDLVIGSDAACRNRLETEGLIGFFVNQLALRVDAPDELSFRDLIGRVREVTLGAYSHQDLPFEQVVGALSPDRSAAYPPIFQVKLNLQNLPASRIEMPGLELKPMAFERTVAELDLTLNLVESPMGVQASAEFNTDLFDPPRVAGWIESFEAVLSAACGDPSATIGDLGREIETVEQGLRAEADARLAAARQSLFKSVRRASPGGAS